MCVWHVLCRYFVVVRVCVSKCGQAREREPEAAEEDDPDAEDDDDNDDDDDDDDDEEEEDSTPVEAAMVPDEPYASLSLHAMFN